MKVALAILCIGAVAFLLRVLAAFVIEGKSSPHGLVRVHFAKFNPVRQRGELIEMISHPQRKATERTNQRIAL
jgi:hypothetical protein